jgi:hypothetical protein
MHVTSIVAYVRCATLLVATALLLLFGTAGSYQVTDRHELLTEGLMVDIMVCL